LGSSDVSWFLFAPCRLQQRTAMLDAIGICCCSHGTGNVITAEEPVNLDSPDPIRTSELESEDDSPAKRRSSLFSLSPVTPRTTSSASLRKDASSPSMSSRHGVEAATAAWRRHAAAMIQAGAADLSAGLGRALSALYEQRSVFSEAVLAFMFQDRPDNPPASPKSEGRDARSPDPPKRNASWPAWPSWTTESAPPGPRSMRLRQRSGKALEVRNGTEVAPSSLIAQITEEPLDHGDLEVLLTRQTSSLGALTAQPRPGVGAGSELVAGKPDYPSTASTTKNAGTNAVSFGLSAQAPGVSWLFRALVDGFMNGPLTGLVAQDVCGDEALQGLAKAWPALSAFLGTIVKVPEVNLHAEQTTMDCMQVEFAAPVDLKAMMVQYPSMAKLLRILKSVRIRLADSPLATRQVGWVTFEDGELWVHFYLHGRHMVWVDMEDRPIVEDGKVLTLEEPIASPECPHPKELTMYWCMDDLRLRLSDFGCIGLSSLALPQMALKVEVMTAPLGNSQENRQGEELQGGGDHDSRRDLVVADIVIRIADMGAFPAETLVRPLFDVKLMRKLLVRTFGMSWSLRPASTGSDWQLLTTIQLSFPKVARAFRMCFKSFVQKQIRECDWFGLLANLFFALDDDLRTIEGEAERGRHAAATKPASGP